jgi:hypothetical protein
MAASSVTGVGPGSADGLNKGSEHMSLAVEKLIGTKIVAAGNVTLSSGAATVVFPQPLSGSKTGYLVFCQTTDATNYSRPNVLTDTSGNFSQFTIAGTTTNNVNWMVVKV